MKKIISISVLILMVIGIVYAHNNYFNSLLVRNRIIMQADATTSTQSAEIYFEAGTADQGTYIYESTDGNLDLVTETSVRVPAGFLTGNASIRGSNTFTTTAAADTVVISGLLATDMVFVTGEYVGGVDQQDVLQAEIKADTLIVHRLANGESAGAYNYLIVR